MKGVYLAAKAVKEALEFFAEEPESDVDVRSRVPQYDVIRASIYELSSRFVIHYRI